MSVLQETHERLLASVLRWNALRIEAARLRKERAGIKCDSCKRDGEEEVGTPCWKWVHEYGPGGDTGGRSADLEGEPWCESCKRRQSIHERFQACAAARGVEIRRIQNLAGQCALGDMARASVNQVSER